MNMGRTVGSAYRIVPASLVVYSIFVVYSVLDFLKIYSVDNCYSSLVKSCSYYSTWLVVVIKSPGLWDMQSFLLYSVGCKAGFCAVGAGFSFLSYYLHKAIVWFFLFFLPTSDRCK